MANVTVPATAVDFASIVSEGFGFFIDDMSLTSVMHCHVSAFSGNIAVDCATGFNGSIKSEVYLVLIK